MPMQTPDGADPRIIRRYDGLVRSPEYVIEQPLLPALEGQRHILPAIGDEIEPEKLDGCKGAGRMLVIGSRNSTTSAAPVLISR